jgi:hypothetical protein
MKSLYRSNKPLMQTLIMKTLKAMNQIKMKMKRMILKPLPNQYSRVLINNLKLMKRIKKIMKMTLRLRISLKGKEDYLKMIMKMKMHLLSRYRVNN